LTRQGIEPRSEIVVPREIARGIDREAEQPTLKRSMFDGLRLRTGPLHEPGTSQEEAMAPKRSMFDGLKLNAGRLPEHEAFVERRAPAPRGLSQALDRYARAWTDAERMRAQDLPVLEHQKIALREAGAALETARPGATRDLLNAVEHHKATRDAMMGMQGRERVAQLAIGIEHEGLVRQDPNLRAERHVKVWDKLEAEHAGLRGRDRAARGEVEARMKAVAHELKSDPALEAAMRSRSKDLGIEAGSRLDRVMRGWNIDRAIGRERGQELER
jgi:hypothetical protein